MAESDDSWDDLFSEVAGAVEVWLQDTVLVMELSIESDEMESLSVEFGETVGVEYGGDGWDSVLVSEVAGEVEVSLQVTVLVLELSNESDEIESVSVEIGEMDGVDWGDWCVTNQCLSLALAEVKIRPQWQGNDMMR